MILNKFSFGFFNGSTLKDIFTCDFLGQKCKLKHSLTAKLYSRYQLYLRIPCRQNMARPVAAPAASLDHEYSYIEWLWNVFHNSWEESKRQHSNLIGCRRGASLVQTGNETSVSLLEGIRQPSRVCLTSVHGHCTLCSHYTHHIEKQARKLLGALGRTTRSKNATRGSWHRY